jgi:DNA-binding SARP family transcriptional activator
MRFQILGPVSVADDSGQLKLDGPRLKALLAYLLLHANKPVSTSDLLEALWGEEQPRSGVTAVQNAVVRLRRTIGDRIVTAGSGYLVRVEAGELDLQIFRDLVERADPAAPAEKVTLLREGLALWNGKALDGIEAAAFCAREAAALEDERLTALAARVDAELDLGRNAELVPLLSTLAAEHPLDERFRAQLIVALYRAGRQAAALDVYRETRRLLMDELGLEPSQSLRDLERAVLTQDPALDYQAPVAPPADPVPVEPPAPTAALTTEDDPSRERRTMRRVLVALSSLGALAIAGIALAVALTREGSAAAPGATTIIRISHVAAAGSTAAPVARTVHKARVTHHIKASIPATVPSRGATVAQSGATTTSSATTASAPSTTKASTTAAVPPTKAPVHKTPAETHAAVTTPNTTTSKTPPPPADVYWLADDFTQPGIDRTIWNLASHGTGVSATEQNGRLELSVGSEIAPDPTYGVDQHYGTACFLTGDFDATVEYKLLDWPVNDGMWLGFGLWLPPPNEAFFSINRVGAAANGRSESYVASGGGYAPTSDTGGMLRLRRKGSSLTMYYRHLDQWVSLGTVPAAGAAQLDLIFAGNDPAFGQQPASVAFDTFDATADTVDCPGLPLPPLKARS